MFFNTGNGNTPHNANGVGWYYSPNFSWGYAAQGLALSLEIVEFSEGGTWKQNNLNARFAAPGRGVGPVPPAAPVPPRTPADPATPDLNA